MISINKNYIKTIKNYLEKLESSSLSRIPVLKMHGSSFDFNQSKLKKTIVKLKQLCNEELLPYQLVEEEVVDKASVVYALGLIVYNTLTDEKYYGALEHKRVKKAFIYQFLNSILIEEDKSITELITILKAYEDDTQKVEKLDHRYVVEIYSSVGLDRYQNEDSFYVKRISNGLTLLTLADGMGGAQAGKLASTKAIKSCNEYISNNKKNIKKQEINEIETLLKNSILKANDDLIDFAKQYDIQKIGTTLTVALIIDNTVHIGHVGDSRAYKLEKNSLPEQLTEDHSVVEVLKRTEGFEEKGEKYSKNILAFALGKELKAKNIFVTHNSLSKDSELLLCSDGFWDNVDEKYFHEEFNLLTQKVLDSIPKDNVTFIRYSPLRKQVSSVNKKWYLLIAFLILTIVLLYTIFLEGNKEKPNETKIENNNSKIEVRGINSLINEFDIKEEEKNSTK